MKTKFRIEISDFAYEKINELLRANKDYSYIRFTSVPFCGSKTNIEISLDNKVEADDSKIVFKDLVMLYKEENLKEYEIVFLIFEDNTFKIKSEKFLQTTASSCGCSQKSNGSCGGCGSSGGCGGCKLK